MQPRSGDTVDHRKQEERSALPASSGAGLIEGKQECSEAQKKRYDKSTRHKVSNGHDALHCARRSLDQQIRPRGHATLPFPTASRFVS
jgi:hypothetical protein